MLFETLKQFYIALGTIYFGLLAGISKDISNFIKKPIKSKILKNIIDVITVIVFSLLFILCINVVNFGEIRLYLLVVFLLGYVLERISLGNLVDFILDKVYNLFKVFISKVSKLKFVKRMFSLDGKKRKKVSKNR